MTIKLNQILYQRSKDWLEKKPNTGILKFLDRRTHKEEDKESFDDYLRDHIKTSNKSINIRGLFRVHISQGEQLMIHVDEREEEEANISPEEIPRMEEIDVSQPILSQPMEMPLRGEPVQGEPERMEIEEMKKDIREGAERIVEENRQELLRKLYGITEDEEQFSIEKEAKTFEDYVELVRKTGGVVAVLDPWSGIPRFVLAYEEDGIKLYPNYSKLLSRYFDFNPDVDPRKFSDVLYKGEVSQDYYGKIKDDEVDDIITGVSSES